MPLEQADNQDIGLPIHGADKLKISNHNYDDAFVFGLGSFVPTDGLRCDPGDLLEIDRTLYTDWALYEGNGMVVHLTGRHGEIIPSETRAIVRRDSLKDVLGNVRVNNKEVKAKERALSPLPVDQVLDKARQMIGQDVDYNILTKNSEHFVTDWKYGVEWSDQASVTLSVFKTLSITDHTSNHHSLLKSLTEVLGTPMSLGSSPPSSRLSISSSPPVRTISRGTSPINSFYSESDESPKSNSI